MTSLTQAMTSPALWIAAAVLAAGGPVGLVAVMRDRASRRRTRHPVRRLSRR